MSTLADKIELARNAKLAMARPSTKSRLAADFLVVDV